MRKGDDGGKKGKKGKIKMFLVATNVVASRPPERRPTATPTARANKHNLSITKAQILAHDELKNEEYQS